MLQRWSMKEDLIEEARVRAIQESICGFVLDEIINKDGEFYADPYSSVVAIEKGIHNF